VTETEFTALLKHPEATWLDWKRNFPPGLIGGKTHPDWQKGRGELLKDLIAIANGSDGHDRGFLVYGVQDNGTNRSIVGLAMSFDDAIFQVWAENTFEPKPTFMYEQLGLTSGQVVSVFTIHRSASFPHVVVADVGDVLHEGVVWFRRGSKNTIAHAAELRTMFVGEKPMVFGSTQDQPLKQLMDSLYTDEWEPVLPYAREKEARVVAGFEVVFWPETRTEVWVGLPGQELILMRRRHPSNNA